MAQILQSSSCEHQPQTSVKYTLRLQVISAYAAACVTSANPVAANIKCEEPQP